MAVTAPTDVSAWIPSIISTKVHDTALDSLHTLSADAQVYPDLEGKAGESFTIPTVGVVSPADNLAVTTPAVDDKLSGAGVPVTIKEAVKSVAFYDRTKYATGTDFNALAGQKVGTALNDRVELDLGAALYAGRNTAADAFIPALTFDALRALKAAIPAGLRRRGITVYADDDSLDALFADELFRNAAQAGGIDELRSGEFSRPVLGMRIKPLDEGVLPVGADGLPQVAAVVNGYLIRAVQKQPSTEVERDARARLTRIVGTTLHGEGVVDSRGVVVRQIGADPTP